MDGLLRLYPAFSDLGRLHLNPSGSRAYLAIPRGERAEATEADLSPWATEMALNMDGRHSVLELCELALESRGELYPAENPQLALEYMVELVTGLANRSIVSLEPMPRHRPVPTTGAQDRYSPTHASVELTDYCNLACRHCYRDSSPACTQFAKTHKLLDWLQELRHVGVAVVELTGGEPTAHPDFARILAECCQLFQLTAVISNGTLWTDEMIDVADQWRERLFLQIDLDGSNAASHNYLRGPGVFEKATETIRKVSARGIPCKVAMSVHARNAAEIIDTAILAHSLGARWFSFGPVMQMGRGHHTSPLRPEHGNMMLDAREDLVKRFPGFVFFGESMELDISKPEGNCGAGWRGIALGPDGRARACVMHSPDHLNFGNLEDVGVAGMLKQIPGDRIRQIPSPNFQDCEGCQHVVFCAGCSARAIQANELHRGKNDGFVCKWDAKYDALAAYAPNREKLPPKSSLKHLV